MQPGIYIAQSRIDPPAPERASAVPVFIGYTQAGGRGALHAVQSWPEFDATLGGSADAPDGRAAACVLREVVRHYFDNGGGPCFILSVDSFASLAGESDAAIAAALGSADLYAVLEQEERITLLALPDVLLFDTQATDPLDTARYIGQVWQAMATACLGRRRRFAVLDSAAAPALAQSLLQSAAQLGGAAHCAVYWPHLLTDYAPPATAESPQWLRLPPSGAVLAAICRTDLERGVWKAPANVALAHVVAPQYDDSAGTALFNQDGVSFNLIRHLAGRGVRIWGCRTLAGGSDARWRYIQVRRLVSHVEASLAELARFSVFEPNNDITWFKLKGQISMWLRKLWHAGALFGVQEGDAFQVAVGLDESMSVSDVDQHRLIVNVGLAVLAPAEFIAISLQFDMSGAAAQAPGDVVEELA